MLYTVSEVATLLKVNRNFVYDEIKKGNLEAVRIGSIKVKKESLIKYINSKADTSFSIPSIVTSIDEYAFRDCYYDLTISFEGTRDQWNELVNGKDIGTNNVICSDETI